MAEGRIASGTAIESNAGAIAEEIKLSSYIPLISTFSLWRRSSRAYVDTYAPE